MDKILESESVKKTKDDLKLLSRKHDESDQSKLLFKSSKSESEGCRKGRWFCNEHIRFVKGCLLYGNNWTKVKECVVTRSSSQIRSHAQKYLIKLCKKYRNHPKFSSKLKDYQNMADVTNNSKTIY